MPCWCILLLVVISLGTVRCQKEAADSFLARYNKEARQKDYEVSQPSWIYNTNITTANAAARVAASGRYSLYAAEVRKNASKIDVRGMDYTTRRQFNFILSTASSKDKATRNKAITLESEMEGLYSKGCVSATSADVTTVKINGTKCLPLNPDLYTILRKSRNYTELLFAWKGWRDATGPKIRPKYQEFVKIVNKGAKENNWKDYGAYLRSWYEVDNLAEIAEKLWQDLKPFYEELHAYVRFKLHKKYPKHVKLDEPVPAHLFGNMWAQQWENIYDLVVPFPGK